MSHQQTYTPPTYTPPTSAPPTSGQGFGAAPGSVAHWVVPAGRSWQSVTAGYVALFALVIWPLGPVALLLGVWAFVRAAGHGGHGRGRATFAVVVGGITTCIMIAVLGYVLTTLG